MTLEEARRSGLPIAVGGSTDVEDTRPDLIGPSTAATPAAQPAPDATEEVVVVHDDAPNMEFPPEPAALDAPASLDAEVEALLQRIAYIESKLRTKLRLNDIHAALDRVDALLQ